MDIPVYMFAGFLGSGKTEFINGILSEGFAEKEKTLVIACEEGELEFDFKGNKNVEMVVVDDQENFNPSYLKTIEKKYKPEQIILEYNGMWPLSTILNGNVPRNWVLYQIMTFIEAETFDLYAKNFGQLMMEKIIEADMVVFNRCNDELKAMLRSRNLRMVNRRAEIFLETPDGQAERYANDDTPPFDMSRDIIEIADEDYGIWYVDVNDFPDRYKGKLVKMKTIVWHSQNYKGSICLGRYAMVCCENDVQFMGFLAKGGEVARYKHTQWVEILAEIGLEEHEAYDGEGPVFYIKEIKPCEKPKEEIVGF